MLTQSAALGLTLAIELPVVLLAAGRLRVRWQRGLAAGLLASGLTHPLAWWVSDQLGPRDYGLWIVFLEILVCLVESAIFRVVMQLAWRWALALSLLANAVSALAGIVLWN